MTAVLLALSSLAPAAPLPRRPPVPPSYSALAGAEWRVDWNGRPYILTLLRCRTYFFEWDPPKSPLWAGVWYVEAGQLRLREWAREGGDAVVEYRFRPPGRSPGGGRRRSRRRGAGQGGRRPMKAGETGTTASATQPRRVDGGGWGVWSTG
jgi:hypothetical protein